MTQVALRRGKEIEETRTGHGRPQIDQAHEVAASRRAVKGGHHCGVWAVTLALVILAVSTALPLARAAANDPGELLTLAPVLEVKLKEWLDAWRVVQPEFKIEQFAKGGTWVGPLTKGSGRGVNLKEVENDPLSAFYALSPEGQWIVDPYGGIFLVQYPHPHLSGGPDTAVHLIDRKLSLLREILMCGTTCGFHEAVWVSKDTFFIAGYQQAEPKKECADGFSRAPTLYSFNLSRNVSTWYRYIGPVSCNGVRGEYVIKKVQKKIPNVK